MCQNKPKEAKCMPKQSQNDLLSGYPVVVLPKPYQVVVLPKPIQIPLENSKSYRTRTPGEGSVFDPLISYTFSGRLHTF